MQHGVETVNVEKQTQKLDVMPLLLSLRLQWFDVEEAVCGEGKLEKIRRFVFYFRTHSLAQTASDKVLQLSMAL